MNEATPIVRGSISPENARAPDEATSSSISSFGVCSTFFLRGGEGQVTQAFSPGVAIYEFPMLLANRDASHLTGEDSVPGRSA